jgi:hypothetical protein
MRSALGYRRRGVAHRLPLLVAGGCLAAGVLPACGEVTTAPPADDAAPPQGSAPPEGSVPAPADGSVVDRLVVAPEGDGAGYDRDLFEHWSDADGDGCDTRCEVLETERRDDLEGLAGGGWLSIYDGYTTPDEGELEIDHVVALAEAWRSGAASWDPGRREAFANDLDDPGALVAVTAATNRSKSDRDPASWQPPDRSAWCWFAGAWATTKVRWELTADRAEVDALRNMLAGC